MCVFTDTYYSVAFHHKDLLTRTWVVLPFCSTYNSLLRLLCPHHLHVETGLGHCCLPIHCRTPGLCCSLSTSSRALDILGSLQSSHRTALWQYCIPNPPPQPRSLAHLETWTSTCSSTFCMLWMVSVPSRPISSGCQRSRNIFTW